MKHKRIRTHSSDGPTSILIRTNGGKTMKETYIKKVRRALLCSAKQKREIVRDLEEIFSSAAEHGESQAEVIARLGAPQDYARAMEESLGTDRKAILRRRALCAMIPPALLAPLFFLLYRIAAPFTIEEHRMSVGIIGGADGPTSILITTSPASPYTAPILLTLCILCAAAAIAALVWYLIKRKR